MYVHSYCQGRGLCFLPLSGRARQSIDVLAYKYVYIHKYIKIKTHRHIEWTHAFLRNQAILPLPTHTYRAFSCFFIFHICMSLLPKRKILVPKNIIFIHLPSLISKIVSECLYQYYYNKQNH